MEQELWSGSTKAIVDPMGAWLTNLSDEQGDILYPKRTLEGKVRGGVFACLPNFGAGGGSGLAQHGFGRTTEWEVLDKTETSILLKLAQPEGDYSALRAILSYQLHDQLLMAALDLSNDGEQPLRVAPAFHPYFATGGGAVKVDGEDQVLDELAEVVFAEGTQHELGLTDRTITCEASNMSVWATWTDQLGPYVCLEPSMAGFSFLNDTPKPEELLQPGETKTFTVTMVWRENEK